jgi:hypothetical protein
MTTTTLFLVGTMRTAIVFLVGTMNMI